MIDNKNINEDDAMRSLLKDSKLTAPDNLQYRIMQQITTEKALQRKMVKSAKPLFNVIWVTMALLYIVVGTIGLAFYIAGGWKALNDVTFYLPVILVSIICSAYGFISVLDERRASK